MKNDLTNEVVGTFKGPGKTGAKHVVQFTKEVTAKYLSFQLKKKKAILQIKEIKLNEKPVIGTYRKPVRVHGSMTYLSRHFTIHINS